jgi:hypothetical protein
VLAGAPARLWVFEIGAWRSSAAKIRSMIQYFSGRGNLRGLFRSGETFGVGDDVMALEIESCARAAPVRLLLIRADAMPSFASPIQAGTYSARFGNSSATVSPAFRPCASAQAAKRLARASSWR